jgi:hypothetical protein
MPLSKARVLRQFRYALFFDGVDDYVSLTRKLFSGVYNTFTFSVWVSPLRFDGGICILHRATHNDQGLVLSPPNRFFFLVMSGGVRYELYSDAVSAGFWYNVVGSYDGSTQKIYVDGVLRNSRTLTVNVDWDLDYIGTFIGVNEPDKWYSLYLNGYIARVLVYSRALSDSEIQFNYSNPDNPVWNGLVLWLKADPAYVKDIDGDGLLEWLDLSGYGNHGKIYGATLIKLIRDPVR